jgi:hypothetical protein
MQFPGWLQSAAKPGIHDAPISVQHSGNILEILSLKKEEMSNKNKGRVV